jgi:carboxyl-terminal processing protease
MACVGLAVVWAARPPGREARTEPPRLQPVATPAPVESDASSNVDDGRAHDFRVPSGQAAGVTCDAARAIVAQARHQLAYVPDPVDPHAFAEAAADWLDPYGLWSVAPDTPVAEAFDAHASGLLADVESRGSTHCAAARALGRDLATWVDDLRATFDAAREHPAGEDLETARATTAFEGATVTRPARALSSTLGSRIGILEKALGPTSHTYAEAARSRYFPALDEDGWAAVVLAAAVRAYVPSIDPHGAWAPLDEESSVYEVDLEARPPLRLWDKSERTAMGIRIDSGAQPPLADGDVVLSLGGVATSGLSFEQAEQLGFATSEQRPPAQAVLLRAGDTQVITTTLDGASADTKPGGTDGVEDGELPVERVPYGDGQVLVVDIQDVRDDLGEELTRTLLRERQKAGPIEGVALDLRGNGGGSTDGAIDALGVFLPGASLFPMRRRDGSLETDRAPEPPAVDRWRGPVASLVDGDTASAAEMIAGAIASYHRGPVVGTTTFGKGCAQEYLDDDARAGVLRLTTLLYALPDGSAVQRVGLLPTLRIPYSISQADDREAALPHAPPVWRGPDVRDRSVLAHAEDGTWTTAWPSHGGNVGPCKDPDVCRALRQLGAVSATARRTGAPKGR